MDKIKKITWDDFKKDKYKCKKCKMYFTENEIREGYNGDICVYCLRSNNPARF